MSKSAKFDITYETLKHYGDMTAYYSKPTLIRVTDSLVNYIENKKHAKPKKMPNYDSFIDFFRKFTNVHEIHYTHIKNSHLLQEIFDSNNLSNLEQFNIITNTLISIPENIGNLTQLKMLVIGNKKLRSLPENIGNLSQLEVLVISECLLLTSLPESIGNLSKLTMLKVDKNKLTSLPESIGNLSRLTTLNVSDNKLTALPESIGNLSHLYTLNVSDNKLTALPESLGKLSKLNTLNISNNNLISFPESINKSKVTVVNIPSQKLSQLSLNNENRRRENTSKQASPQLNSKNNNNSRNRRRERSKHNDAQHINAINISDLTNNMFTVPASQSSVHVFPRNVSTVAFDTIMSNIEKNMSAIDQLILQTYSFRGDYFINKFLSTNIFDVANSNKNTYNISNTIRAFRDISIYIKLIKRFPPTNKMNNDVHFRNMDSYIRYKQELIYYAFLMTYNTVIRVNKMIKEKTSITAPFQVFRGSKTHYLKEIVTNKFYYFDSFVSTTTEYHVAATFSTSGYNRGPLYLFFINPSCYFCYLSQGLSRYPREKEVLLTPYHRYYFVRKDKPINGQDVYVYYILPPDLDIPTTFDTFVEWKNTVKRIETNSKNIIQNGGKTNILNNHLPSISQYVNTWNTRKNISKNLKLNRNTKKNIQSTVKMNTRKNIQHSTQPNTKTPTKKALYDAERMERWTEPLTYFEGKEPTPEELALINNLKAYLDAGNLIKQ